MTMSIDFYNDAERFVSWLERRVISDARGESDSVLKTKPADRFWLGRLASVSSAEEQAKEERILRLDPCAMGFTFQPSAAVPWNWQLHISLRLWTVHGKGAAREWHKSEPLNIQIPITVTSAEPASLILCEGAISSALHAAGHSTHRGRIDLDVATGQNRPTVTVTFVNASENTRNVDSTFYEVAMKLEVGHLEPFVLDSLADSFRYDRDVIAYGVNCGVTYADSSLFTEDSVSVDKMRPEYWDTDLGPEPDISFEALATDPLPHLHEFVEAMERWYARYWAPAAIQARSTEGRWSKEMEQFALEESVRAFAELDACKYGLQLLEEASNHVAFKLMNEAFSLSGAGKYTSWRPFQLGFLLTALEGVIFSDVPARRTVSTLWFATGGGKTETYLALVVFGMFLDRLSGKTNGIGAWSRFPLRMLSLQQTQRFADVVAAAELVRRRSDVVGEEFSLGYFVGNNGTPNRVRFDPKHGEADASDAHMPSGYRVLLYCPFCKTEDLVMLFDEETWTLQHRCSSSDCEWSKRGLPFYVVDEEIYRNLPSVVVGTLDKAASVGIQAAMRGFYAAPAAKCEGPGHGFTYALRSNTSPTGCLVPDCKYPASPLGQSPSLYAPRIRIQDELHLLADSLGAIDSHYETLLDHLTVANGGSVPKIIASSATLAGFSNQTKTLYCREGAAFPMPGPQDGSSFWSLQSDRLMRRYVALAPRGHTQEYANDSIAASLQNAVREFLIDPRRVCEATGINPSHVNELVGYYGTNVIYGSKLRDVEGAARSLESQPPATPTNVATLTSATPLPVVLDILRQMKTPDPDFNNRLHVVCCSSMMSHGVDVDRFNTMTMIGMPLSTAEFIQTSARIGRQMPGLLIVLHRMAVERDAKLYRLFDMFVKHGDRLIEPVAITRYSRRVLLRTAPGLFMSDIYGVYEPDWIAKGNRPLTTATQVRQLARSVRNFDELEYNSMADALQFDDHTPPPFMQELRSYVDRVMYKIEDVASNAKFASDLAQAPQRVLISLRDVEERIPIREAVD